VQSSKVTLVRASKNDESTLRNLLHLYIHDFSEFLGMKPSEEGWFSYPALPLYLSDTGRAAFLVRSEGALVGFALVTQGSVVTGDPAVFDVAEFFVVRGIRRRGVGEAAAHELFRLFPRKWEVRVADYNEAAQCFWRNAIEHFTCGEFQSDSWSRSDGSKSTVFRFTSQGADEGGSMGPN
jgi:predicted acetyltransferase